MLLSTKVGPDRAVIFTNAKTLLTTLLVRHLKSQWLTWLLLFTLYGVIHANYRLVFNQTPSLPFTLLVIALHEPVEAGEYLAFIWHHGPPYPTGHTFVKQVLAGPGDTVIRSGRNFKVNERTLVGQTIGLSLKPLYPNDELSEGTNTIGFNHYFVAGTHKYSLDSRYNLLGLVHKRDVIGRAYPLF
jgi:conjugal transfer pilin signal peptidase TrbI